MMQVKNPSSTHPNPLTGLHPGTSERVGVVVGWVGRWTATEAGSGEAPRWANEEVAVAAVVGSRVVTIVGVWAGHAAW